MKIGYMLISILFGCYVSFSIACSEHEKMVKNIAALSLSASPSGATFVPPSTPPIPTSMVSPYREPYYQGVAEWLEKEYSSEKKFIPNKNNSPIIIERVLSNHELPISFAKIPIEKEALEDEKERPLSVGVDSRENEHEALFAMDEE
jgi:hypothetical protein